MGNHRSCWAVGAGTIPAGQVGTNNASVSALTQSLSFAINDNNAAGVTAATGASNLAAAAAVTTGWSFPSPWPTRQSSAWFIIKISAMINNGSQLSGDQTLGSLPPHGTWRDAMATWPEREHWRRQFSISTTACSIHIQVPGSGALVYARWLALVVWGVARRSNPLCFVGNV